MRAKQRTLNLPAPTLQIEFSICLAAARKAYLIDELSTVFKGLGDKVWDKYGWSTTWMKKLLPRIDGGGGGGCPILVFGITKKAYNERA